MAYSNSSDIIQELSQAPLIEKKTISETEYVMYFGFPMKTDTTRCSIKRITYIKDNDSEIWTTKFPDGSKEQRYDWEGRENLNYDFYK